MIREQSSKLDYYLIQGNTTSTPDRRGRWLFGRGGSPTRGVSGVHRLLVTWFKVKLMSSCCGRKIDVYNSFSEAKAGACHRRLLRREFEIFNMKTPDVGLSPEVLHFGQLDTYSLR